jgi:hypothetical protein
MPRSRDKVCALFSSVISHLKFREILHCIGNYQLLKKGSTVWSYTQYTMVHSLVFLITAIVGFYICGMRKLMEGD